jgi:hypothetical protein
MSQRAKPKILGYYVPAQPVAIADVIYLDPNLLIVATNTTLDVLNVTQATNMTLIMSYSANSLNGTLPTALSVFSDT